MAKPVLKLHQKVPNASESAAVGTIIARISRNSERFNKELVRYSNPDIVVKDEEKTGADYYATPKLVACLSTLATKVKAEWGGAVKLRVTEAWDENIEHHPTSTHYEGRAADLTTFPIDPTKLGRLGQLAVESGFGWVFYENNAHIHVSVKREAPIANRPTQGGTAPGRRKIN